MTSPIERALLTAIPWLIAGLVTAPLWLIFGEAGPTPTGLVVAQLSVLVGIGLSIADRLAVYLLDDGWFCGGGWTRSRRMVGAGVVLVIIPTGAIGLISLASAAALRLDPSVQFLQLLSALDIVWAGAALLYGAFVLWGRLAARLAALVLGVACVASLWNYLRIVGFGQEGEWIVDGGRLLVIVIPFDMIAATVAIVVLTVGLRRRAAEPGSDQRMEQASDQS